MDTRIAQMLDFLQSRTANCDNLISLDFRFDNIWYEYWTVTFPFLKNIACTRGRQRGRTLISKPAAPSCQINAENNIWTFNSDSYWTKTMRYTGKLFRIFQAMNCSKEQHFGLEKSGLSRKLLAPSPNAPKNRAQGKILRFQMSTQIMHLFHHATLFNLEVARRLLLVAAPCVIAFTCTSLYRRFFFIWPYFQEKKQAFPDSCLFHHGWILCIPICSIVLPKGWALQSPHAGRDGLFKLSFLCAWSVITNATTDSDRNGRARTEI